MFKESDNKLDVQKFLSRSIQDKELHSSASDLITLLTKLTEIFPINIQFYSEYIISKCCIPIMRATQPNAKFKELSVKLIHAIVVHNALDEDINIEQLIRDLMLIFDQKVKFKCMY